MLEVARHVSSSRIAAWRQLLQNFLVINQESTSMSFGKTTPILRIFDEAKAVEFYVDFLGFKIDWQHRFEANFPLYLQVSRGECVLHLSEHHGDCSPGSALRIETDELETFQKELDAKDYRYAHPSIQATPWGSMDMTINDPFGNRLVFTNAISV